MKAFQLFKEEWLAVLKDKKVIIPVIAVMFIPLLYAFMFLKAFWDPYDHLKNLPVAVVNLDEGANFEGEHITVGEDLIEELKESDEDEERFDWHFISKEEANEGLHDFDYYMTIEIPEDFSERVTTLQDEDPEKLSLIYRPNEGYNFLSAQIGESGINKLKEQLSNEITYTYTEKVYDSIFEISDGLAEAGDGASELNDGIEEIKDGMSDKEQDIEKLADGSKELNDKIQTEVKGLEESLANAESSIKKLEDLAAGSAQVSGGVNDIKNSLTNAKDSIGKLEQLAAGSAKVSDGTDKLVKNTDKLISGMEGSKEKVNELSEGNAYLNEKVQEKIPELQKQLNAINTQVKDINKLAAGSEELYNGTSSMLMAFKDEQGDLKKLINGSNKSVKGVNNLVDGIDSQIAELNKNNENINSGTLSSVLGQLGLSNEDQTALSTLNDDQQEALVNMLKTINNQTVSQLETMKEVDGEQNDINDLKIGLETLSTGLENLQTGLIQKQTEVVAGAEEVKNGNAQIQTLVNEKLDSIDLEEIQEEIAGLPGKTQKLSDGAAKINTGWNDVIDNLNQLNKAQSQLADGASQVADGNAQVEDMAKSALGSNKINDLNRIADGASQVADGNAQVESLAKSKLSSLDTSMIDES
ncbi:YhgE/Pip domain-containing protein [Bacillus carboniphilus]|uniref:YhgE/Pip domain-containing protein n=1 Tax=Bacillus carboniphilus TaxID=86663 RepID=A0ABY9JWK2_9BACI|nr:YhgE/Pip domain-containing protein [Bacillus carboniphilus]WLR42663.1 YhgE/Pip domain-containing protein [Bacillus carboniphilus]